MSKAQHTPGPWYVGAQNDGMYITAGEPPSPSNDYMVHDSDRTLIAKMSGETFEMDAANARLIAAAPELLEALESFVSHGSCYDETDMQKARTALAKAKGELK